MSTEVIVDVPGRPIPYRWIEAWGEMPAHRDRRAWAHPGLTVAGGLGVLVGDTAKPRIHVLDAGDGTRLRSIDVPALDVHGLTLDPRAAGLGLWVADQGIRMRVAGTERVLLGPGAGVVLRYDDATATWTTLEPPPHPRYREKPYRPTYVAVDPGSDDVWICDGYGASLVHRYGRDGAYRSTLRPGPDDDDTFDTPHAAFVDRRPGDPRLLVADRRHRRVRTFDLDGAFAGDLPAPELNSPSGFAALGDLTLVAELNASIAVLDPDGHLVGRIGEGAGPDDRAGWPNAQRRDGTLVRPRLRPGRFNAPHAIDVGADGSIYVAEFVVGGRLVRLAPAVG